MPDVLDAASGKGVDGLVQLRSLSVPEAALPLFARVVEEIAKGHTVAVQPVSTTEAAAILNVSRPTLINLLEAGEIDDHRVGTHRRVSHSSLFQFKRRMESGAVSVPRPTRDDRLRGLREMARIGGEAGGMS